MKERIAEERKHMGTLKKTFVLCLLAAWLGGCIPDSLDDCPPSEPETTDNKVDITVDMDTEIDMGEQETEMP